VREGKSCCSFWLGINEADETRSTTGINGNAEEEEEEEEEKKD